MRNSASGTNAIDHADVERYLRVNLIAEVAEFARPLVADVRSHSMTSTSHRRARGPAPMRSPASSSATAPSRMTGRRRCVVDQLSWRHLRQRTAARFALCSAGSSSFAAVPTALSVRLGLSQQLVDVANASSRCSVRPRTFSEENSNATHSARASRALSASRAAPASV